MTRWLAGVTIALGVLGAAPAWAAEPSEEDVARAREQFASGLKLEDAGKWDAALEAFRAVAAVRSTPQVRYHVGLCLEHTGRLVEAVAELERAEADARASTDSEQALVSARAGQRAVTIRARTPRLSITGAPPQGVKVVVDGKAKRLEKDTLSIDPGSHQVRVDRDGATVFSRTVTAREQDPPHVLTIDASGRKPEEPGGGDLGPAPWIAVAVSGVALAGAGVTFFLRSSALSDLDALCGADRMSCPAGARQTFDRAEDLTTTTNVLLVTAGVAALAAAALFVIPKLR